MSRIKLALALFGCAGCAAMVALLAWPARVLERLDERARNVGAI